MPHPHATLGDRIDYLKRIRRESIVDFLNRFSPLGVSPPTANYLNRFSPLGFEQLGIISIDFLRWTLDGPWMDPGWTLNRPRTHLEPTPNHAQIHKINQIAGFEPWDPSHQKERAKICRKLKSRASETFWASSYGQITCLEPEIWV